MTITLHSKLGINPRMINIHCFACGQTKGDSIALLGASNRVDKCPECNANIFGGVRRREKCPKCNHSRNYEKWESRELDEYENLEQNGICKECREFMKAGIILISVKDTEEGKENPYRTGGWIVLKEEAIRRMLSKEIAEEICKRRMAFVPDKAWDKIGFPRK